MNPRALLKYSLDVVHSLLYNLNAMILCSIKLHGRVAQTSSNMNIIQVFLFLYKNILKLLV